LRARYPGTKTGAASQPRWSRIRASSRLNAWGFFAGGREGGPVRVGFIAVEVQAGGGAAPAAVSMKQEPLWMLAAEIGSQTSTSQPRSCNSHSQVHKRSRMVCAATAECDSIPGTGHLYLSPSCTMHSRQSCLPSCTAAVCMVHLGPGRG
jgi:hypothetical protein